MTNQKALEHKSYEINKEKFDYIPKEKRLDKLRATWAISTLNLVTFFFFLGGISTFSFFIDSIIGKNFIHTGTLLIVSVIVLLLVLPLCLFVRKASSIQERLKKNIFLSEVKDQLDELTKKLEEERKLTMAFEEELKKQARDSKNEETCLYEENEELKTTNKLLEDALLAEQKKNLYLKKVLEEVRNKSNEPLKTSEEDPRISQIVNDYLNPKSKCYLPRLDAFFDVLEDMKKQKLTPADRKKFGYMENRQPRGTITEVALEIYNKKFGKQPVKSTVLAFIELTKLER